MSKRQNCLNHAKVYKMAVYLNEIKDELMKTRPGTSDVAQRLTKDLGFPITKRNIEHLIFEGLIPDFRPEYKNSGQIVAKRKISEDVEALRQIVEEQDARINRLEILLGASKLEERMNGKTHSKVAM